MAKEPAWIKMTPAMRMTKGLCPECGVDMTEEDPKFHRDSHWDEKLLRREPESDANVRANMLDNYIKDRAEKAEKAKVKPKPEDESRGGATADRENTRQQRPRFEDD